MPEYRHSQFLPSTQHDVQHGQLSTKSAQSDRNAGYVLLNVVQTASGIVPLKLLASNRMDVNLFNIDISDGRVPVSMF